MSYYNNGTPCNVLRQPVNIMEHFVLIISMGHPVCGIILQVHNVANISLDHPVAITDKIIYRPPCIYLRRFKLLELNILPLSLLQ